MFFTPEAKVMQYENHLRKMEQLRQRIVKSGYATEDEIEGCEPHEIEKLKSVAKIELPQDYLAFMEVMGKYAGRHVCHSDTVMYYSDELLALGDDAREMLHLYEGKTMKLPGDVFVFWLWECEFLFFMEVDSGVLSYHVNSHKFERPFESFYELMLKTLDDLDKIRARNPYVFDEERWA